MNEVQRVTNYVGTEHSSMVTNEQVKAINETDSHKEKEQVCVTKSIAISGSTSTDTNVPGIEFLLSTDMSNSTMGSYESVQNYVQMSNSDQAKHYQHMVDEKHADKISVSVQNSYQQLVNATLQAEKLSESAAAAQNYNPQPNHMNSNKVEDSLPRYQTINNEDHKDISGQNYQQLRANQIEKLNESAQNHQSLSNPAHSESVQNYQQMNKLTRTDKSNESVQNYQEIGKSSQSNKSHESVANYHQQLDQSMQSNRLDKASQKFQHLGNPVQTEKMNESIQKLSQMSNSSNIGKPGDSIQRVQISNSIQTVNEAVINYQQTGNSEQKLNESVQNYGQLLEYTAQSNKLSVSTQNFHQIGNEGLVNACVKPNQNYQQLENSAQNVKKVGSNQNYQQLGNSNHNRAGESVHNFQQVGNSGQSNQSNIGQSSEQSRENKSLVSIAQSNQGNVVVNTIDSSVLSVSRGHSVQRKPVGIREPIVIREQVSSATNVPGIEYLLHNDLRNPSMINTAYLRASDQFRGKQSNDGGSPNQHPETGNRREYKNDPMVSNTIFNHQANVTVVDRSGEIGTIISRDLSVPRKPVGIREPIVMRESMSSPNSVPGIEYLLHNEVSSENISKKSRPPKEERPFLCTTCGNKFRQQSHLQQHIRIHTNHRPYQCSFCEKAFKQKSQLNQHERIHTGEKPYKCGICEKAFAQAGQLYSHRKTHGLNINEIKTQRDGSEKTPKKRGRRAKIEEIASNDVSPPPSVIYIMEPTHQRPPRPIHFQFPRPINDFRPHLFNNGGRYSSEKLPKIETVVSMGPRTRMPPSNSPINTSTDNSSQLCHWKHDSSKESNSDT